MVNGINLMVKKAGVVFIVSAMLLFINIEPAFGQVEFLSTEEAKQSIKTEVTSLDKDKAIDKNLHHISDVACENRNDILFCLSNPFIMPVGLKVIVTDTPTLLCLDAGTGTVGLRKMEKGIYTITGKILFKEQWEKYRDEYFWNLTRSDNTTQFVDRMSRDRNQLLLRMKADGKKLDEPLVEEKTAEVPDEVFFRLFTYYCNEHITQTEDDFLLNGWFAQDSKAIIMFSDDKGNTYYYGWYERGKYEILEDLGKIYDDISSWEFAEEPTFTLSSKVIPMSYYEKISNSLVNKQCHIINSIASMAEYFQDAISGDVVPMPKEDQTFTCEKIALVGNDSNLVGIFSNGADSFSLSLGSIRPAVFGYEGSSLGFPDPGDSYYYDSVDGELKLMKYDLSSRTDYEIGRMRDYPYLAEGWIDAQSSSLRVVPVQWKEEQDRIVAKVNSEREKEIQNNAKRFAEYVRTREQDVLNKYGEYYGSAINSRQVKIGMTKAMAMASWGFPMNTYSRIQSNETVEVWLYANAALSFVNGELKQIERIR